ncbi:nadD [Symbiodinium sp. CCMP2456]|nr:nadD [Symbiodinium sp. CCMP2456]
MAYPNAEAEAVPAPRRVAIYGGAFDPPTNSHLTCAAEIVHSGCADEVWLVPCGPRPDKPKLKTPAIDRYCMCQIAVNTVFSPDFPVKVSDVDIGKKMAAFTYDLLVELKERSPSTEFAFVIGSDWLQPGTNLAEWTSLNPEWKEGMPEAQREIVTGHKLLQEFEFLVVPRPGYDVARTEADPTGLRAFGPRLRWMEMPEQFHFIEGNLSSTEIRTRTQYTWRVKEAAKGGGAIEGLVPPGVLAYIRRGRLYRP